MSQFPLPGVQKQYKGSDFRGTSGLYAGESGSVASGVVVFSELDRQKQAFDAAVANLETSFRAADTSDTQAWQAATSNISRQLNNLAQGVANRLAVAVRWEGSVADLQSVMTVSSAGVASIPQATGAAVAIASVNADFATNEDYYAQVKAKSWESIVLIHNLTTASETGLYCVSGGILQKFSPFFSQLRDGALIFVDAGEKSNSFWSIADPTIVSENNVVIPLLIPFGAFTALQTEPNGFLSIAANQLNAALDGAYFVVVGGQLTMTPAFVARVTNLETGLQSAQANISTLQTGLQSETTARTSADATMQIAIDGKASTAALQAEVTARSGADTALQSAIDTKASGIALQAEGSARSSADGLLQTAIDGNSTAIQTEVTARTAADATLQTAIATNSTAIQTEVTARTAADGLLAIDIAARTTAAQLHSAIADFTAYSHPIKALTNGVFNTVGGVPMTTFYVPLSDSLDWGVDRYSESAAPFTNVQMPIVSYVNANATGVSGFFVKLEFQSAMQVPNDTIEVYLTRHYRAGQTGIAFFLASAPTSGTTPPPPVAPTNNILVIDGVNWMSVLEDGFYTVVRPFSVPGSTYSTTLIQKIQTALTQKYGGQTTYDSYFVGDNGINYFFYPV